MKFIAALLMITFFIGCSQRITDKLTNDQNAFPNGFAIIDSHGDGYSGLFFLHENNKSDANSENKNVIATFLVNGLIYKKIGSAQAVDDDEYNAAMKDVRFRRSNSCATIDFTTNSEVSRGAIYLYKEGAYILVCKIDTNLDMDHQEYLKSLNIKSLLGSRSEGDHK